MNPEVYHERGVLYGECGVILSDIGGIETLISVLGNSIRPWRLFPEVNQHIKYQQYLNNYSKLLLDLIILQGNLYAGQYPKFL